VSAGDLLSLLPGRWLAPAVRRLAPRPALDWYPGWHFAVAEETPTVAVRLRRALWQAGARHRPPTEVRLRWYDDLEITTSLGTDLSRCIFVSGSYEPNEFMLLAQVLAPGMTFVDVGSNEGLYTLFASRRVAPHGQVVALEPSTREFSRLGRNLQLNRIDNVSALRLAAGAEVGAADLHVAEEAHAGQNSLGSFAYAIRDAGTERVEVLPLDHLAERVDLKRLDVVKIDAEGSEVAVLRGACEILARERPLLLTELLDASLRGQGVDRADLFEVLEPLGYEYWVFGANGVVEPVDRVDRDGVNFVAAHPERRFGLRR